VRRQGYLVDKNLADRAEAVAVTAAVLDVLRPVIDFVSLDLVSDYEAELPADARAALAVLRPLASRRSTSVDVRTSAPQWSAVEAYAAWSIHVTLLGEGGHVGTLHDCSYSVYLKLLPHEADVLSRELADVAALVPVPRRRERLRAFIRRSRQQ
jgi:hypothetical protein